MMEKKTFKDVITMLQEQQHVAPAGWDEIAEELDFADNFSNLKTFKVEKDLWSGIEEALVEEPRVEQPKFKIHHLVLRYAAIGLLLIGLTFVLLPKEREETFAYSSEVEYGAVRISETESEDVSFNEGKDFISENSFLYSARKLKEYQVQLEDLETAIADVAQMQEQYGTDADGLKLLAKMERQKATLIKSMINKP